jgi:hypothetical protein
MELRNIKISERIIVDWDKIHFGKISKKEIAEYVKENGWQILREYLKGKSLEDKYLRLFAWVYINKCSRASQVQVTNYVNALKRGGLIK